MKWLQADNILLVTVAWLGWRDLKDKRELLHFFHARRVWSGPLASSRCLFFVFRDHDANTTTLGQDGHNFAKEVQQIESLGNCTAAILTASLRPLRSLDDVVRYVFANLPRGIEFLGQPWTEEYVLFLLPTMTFISDPLPIISRCFASTLKVTDDDYNDIDGDTNVQGGAVELLMADILTTNRTTPICGYNVLFLSKSLVISSHTRIIASQDITWCEHIFQHISTPSIPLSSSPYPSPRPIHWSVPKELNIDFVFDVKQQLSVWDDVSGVRWEPANASEIAMVHFDSVTGYEIDIINFNLPPDPNDDSNSTMMFFNCDFQVYGMWDVVAYATHPGVQKYLSLLETNKQVSLILPHEIHPLVHSRP